MEDRGPDPDTWVVITGVPRDATVHRCGQFDEPECGQGGDPQWVGPWGDFRGSATVHPCGNCEW